MARIKYSALVTEIAGSVGGTTFQRNAYGYTIKNKPNMVAPSRSAQTFRQNRFNVQIQKWKALTQAQRDLWISYAVSYPVQSRKNPDSNLNGYNYFERYHLVRELANLIGTLENPNGTRGEVTAVDLIISRVGATLFFEGADIVTINDWQVIIELTNIVPASQVFIQQTPFYMASYNRNIATDVELTSSYLAKYGRLPEIGDKVGARVYYLNRSAGQIIGFPLQPVIVQ